MDRLPAGMCLLSYFTYYVIYNNHSQALCWLWLGKA